MSTTTKKERRDRAARITYSGHPKGAWAELQYMGRLTEKQFQRKCESMQRLIGTKKLIDGHDLIVCKLQFGSEVFGSMA